MQGVSDTELAASSGQLADVARFICNIFLTVRCALFGNRCESRKLTYRFGGREYRLTELAAKPATEIVA